MVATPICPDCWSFSVWFPDMFYKRTPFTSLGKNPKEPTQLLKGFFAGVVIWAPWTEQQIKSLCDVRLTREYNDVQPNMLVKGNGS